MHHKRMLLHILKTIILFLLFYGAVYFENAQQQRLFVLMAVFILYLGLGLSRDLFKKKETIFCISFFLDIALVYTLEYNSRLLINYFIHFFYLMILLEAFLLLKRKWALVIGTSAVIVSLIKYGFLIYYKFSLSTVSQLVFFLLANVLVLMTVSFAQYYREEREKKDILYQELLDTHKQLKRYVNEVSRLTVVEERNRIARDLHDTLGHNMTALIMQMEMAGHMMMDHPNEAGEVLEQGKKTARESLSGIREVVETLRGKNSSLSFVNSIEELVQDFSQKTGVQIHLKISDQGGMQKGVGGASLYRIIQEALTNAVRHGKAAVIEINIEYSNETVKFIIKDNGCGTSDFTEGYGLKGIRERVKAQNGGVEFLSKDGFLVKGFICLEGKND